MWTPGYTISIQRKQAVDSSGGAVRDWKLPHA